MCEVNNGYAAIVAYSQNTCPLTPGLEEMIEEIKEKIDEVKIEVDDNGAKLDLNANKIEEVKTQVDENKDTLDLIPEKIEGVKTEVDENEVKLDLNAEKIEDVKTNVAEVNTEVEEVKEIVEDIQNIVRASVVEQVLQKVTSVVDPVKPAMLRLTFHSCVGGCDGCLNVNDPDNAGLENLVADLEEVYQSEGLADIISRADLWALLGIWAVEETIDKSNEECGDCDTVPDLQVEFQWGRVVSGG